MGNLTNGETMHHLLLVTDIEWDTDDASREDCSLPLEVVVISDHELSKDELENGLSEALSDAYGFCHRGFNTLDFFDHLGSPMGNGPLGYLSKDLGVLVLKADTP